MDTINPPLESSPRAATSVHDGVATAAPLASESALSWRAIIAGAVAAAALALILMLLSTGLGLLSVSPWAGEGVSATTFGVWTIIWILFIHLAASGMGGYLTGRLRPKWTLAPNDEVYFRDTAHGFLAWALATLITAGLLTSAIGSIINQGVDAGAEVAAGATTAAVAGAGAAAVDQSGAQSGSAGMGLGYFVDSLFRKDATTAPTIGYTSSSEMTPTESTGEVIRIFANDLESGLTAEDTRYVAQLVQERTGLSQSQAEQRVTETFAAVQSKINEAQNAAREAADEAREAAATASLWMFVALLVGAFAASLAATFGGRSRDLLR